MTSGTRYWWRNNNGTYPKALWATLDNHTYRFDTAGYLQTGWYTEAGTWYHLATDGTMTTGWYKDGQSWYHLNPTNGKITTGWLRQGTTWYHLGTNGTMTTGWLKQGTTWYHLSADGTMTTTWLKDGQSWYYLNPTNGKITTGSITVDGKTETFTSKGVWIGYHAPAGYLQPTDQITTLGWSTSDLVSGSTGVKVRIVQQRLGIWSSGTLASVNDSFQSAVRNFQRRTGLAQTGIVDETTWNAMATGYSWWVDQYQATPVSLSATREERIEALIGYAWNQIGSPYTWGGTGPYDLGFDCSGLTLQSLYRAGMGPEDNRTSRELYGYSGFQHVPFSQRQRGDLIFYRTRGTITHVAIYLGDNQVIHTDWMDNPARVDSVNAGYSWSQIDSQVVRPVP